MLTTLGWQKIDEPQGREIIKLPCRISQETLKRRWIESSQEYHGQEPSQVSITKPIVKRDRAFSPEPNEGNDTSVEESSQESDRPEMISGEDFDADSFWNQIRSSSDREYGGGTFKHCCSIVDQINEGGMTNDIAKLKSWLAKTPTLAILDVALLVEEGIETLRTLFILRGYEITITNRHIEIVAHRTSSDTDILELVLLLRGDQLCRWHVWHLQLCSC